MFFIGFEFILVFKFSIFFIVFCKGIIVGIFLKILLIWLGLLVEINIFEKLLLLLEVCLSMNVYLEFFLKNFIIFCNSLIFVMIV